MARLPKYVFRRANGSYRYKRNVPKHLLPLIGKETLYRQLGDTLQEALRTLPRVHAEIEDLFRGEDNTPSSERALRIIKASLGTEIAGWVEAGIVPEYSQEEAELNDLGRSLEGKLPKDIVRQIYSGKLIKEPLTLSKALDEYEAYKLDGSPKDREVISRNAKVKQDLKAALSKVKLEVIPLLSLERADATAYRDHLLKRLKPSSVQRHINTVRAAVNLAITEHGLNSVNIFVNLKVKGAGASKDDRLPLSDLQVAELAPAFASDPEVWGMFVTLQDSGARLSEILFLRVGDVSVQERSIRITPNEQRGLKTKSSDRTIPISPAALTALQGLRAGKDDDAFIFPRYAKLRGRDAASAMLMKRFRKVITDTKLVIHSLRHRMKDKLRNTGCPESISMAIMGHSTNSIASNYGSGYALDVMRGHMERVW